MWKELLTFFLTITFIYLLCASGHVDTKDAEPSIAVAQSIINAGRLSVDIKPKKNRSHRVYYARHKKGPWYSKMGLALPVLYVAPVALAQHIHTQLNVPEGRLVHFFISLINPILTALIITLLFFYFRSERMSLNTSLAIACCAAFATLLFPYSKTSSREPLQALCLLAAFVFALKANKEKTPNAYLLSGLAIGVGLLTKIALVVPMVPAYLLGVFYATKSPQRWKSLTALSIFPTLSAALWFWFANHAFGSPFSTGYSRHVTQFHKNVWSVPINDGLHIQLTSLDSGILFYCPILIPVILLIGANWLKNRIQIQESFILLSTLGQLLLHSRWADPAGGQSLGARYMVTLLPLIFLFLSRIPPNWYHPRWLLVPTLSLALFASTQQWTHVFIKSQLYWTLKQKSETPLTTPHWKANWQILKQKLANNEEQYIASHFGGKQTTLIDLQKHESLVGFNFWWTHANRYLNRPVPVAKQR